MTISREINVGSIIHLSGTLIGYLLLALWFAAQLSAGQAMLERKINSLEIQVRSLSARIDAHIDRAK